MVMWCRADPWAGAQAQANNFARIDRNLARKLEELQGHQSHETKLVWALESYRCYGLRTQKCDMLQKRELNKQFAHAPAEPMW